MHRLEVYVIDDDEDYDIDNYITEIAQLDCGNAFFQVKDAATADIGEWHDEHECNYGTTPVERFREYFNKK